MTTTVTRWDPIMRSLHWLMALLLVVQWASGEWDDWLGVKNHVSLGLLVLLLACLRLGWRLTHPAPAHGSPLTLPDRIAAGVHVMFYLVMIGLPITGILWRQAKERSVEFFGLFPLPTLVGADKGLASSMHEAHEIGATVFLVLLGLHVAGALKRQYIDKQNIIGRMLP